MIRNRKQHAPSAAEVTEPEAPEMVEPAAETAPAGFAAQAAQLRLEAGQARDLATANRGQAQQAMAAARTQAAGIVVRAEAGARELGADADASEQEAHRLEERAQLLTHAAALQASADEHARTAAELQAEREHLAEVLAGLNCRLTELDGEQQGLTAQLSAARQNAEVDLIASLRGKLEAVQDATAALDGQRKTAQARSDAIGDGSEAFPGELSRATGAAQAVLARLRKVLNILDPERPEAVHDRTWGEITAMIQAQQERIAEEQRKPQPQPRIGHL